MDIQKSIIKYVNGIIRTYSNFPVRTTEEVVQVLFEAYQRGKVIYTMGNGGSGLNAAHLVQDLAKHTIVSDDKKKIVNGKRFKIMCLNESISCLSAWANDVGYDEVFSQQLINWVQEGDVIFGFSGSGNSKNILNAFKVAKEKKAITISLTGGDGGRIRELSDICVIVPSDVNYHIEDVHSSLVHIWCDILRFWIQNELKGE